MIVVCGLEWYVVGSNWLACQYALIWNECQVNLCKWPLCTVANLIKTRSWLPRWQKGHKARRGKIVVLFDEDKIRALGGQIIRMMVRVGGRISDFQTPSLAKSKKGKNSGTLSWRQDHAGSLCGQIMRMMVRESRISDFQTPR